MEIRTSRTARRTSLDIDGFNYVDIYIKKGSDWGCVTLLTVSRQDQGKGYARLLMERIIKEARSRELKSIRLTCNPFGYGLDFEGLLAFYKRLGFEEIARREEGKVELKLSLTK